MRKKGMTKRLQCGLTALVLGLVFASFVPKNVYAEDFVYQSEENSYTITQTSGDITQAFTAAVTAAYKAGPNAVTIKIKPGKYEIGRVAIKNSDITIDATGATFVANALTKDRCILAVGVEAKISSMVIKGGKWDSNHLASHGFFLSGQAGPIGNLVLEDCEFVNAKNRNLYVQNANKLTLNKVLASNGGYGITAENSKDVVVTNCEAQKNEIGFAFRDSKVTVTDCKIQNNTVDGLQVKFENGDVVLNGGMISQNQKNGISLTEGAKLTLNHVTITNNKANGISPVGTKGKKTTLVATECTINNNGRHGIAADYYVTLDVTHCQVNENAANGVFLNHGCVGANLSDITACKNGFMKSEASGCGIAVQNGSTCAKIENCICDNNGKIGFFLSDLQTTVKNCSMNGNGRHGCYVCGTAKKTVRLDNCSMNSNKADGLMATAKKTVILKNCKLNKNGNCGVESDSCNIQVSGKASSASSNKKHGYANRSGKLVVKDAKIENNKTYGVYLSGTKSGSEVTGCTLKKNGTGVCISNGAVVKRVSNNTFVGNKKGNLIAYTGESKKKTSLGACEKNSMMVSSGSVMQISYDRNVNMPSGIKKIKGKAAKDKCGNTFKVGKK